MVLGQMCSDGLQVVDAELVRLGPGAEPDQLVGGGQQHLEELVQGGVGVADHQQRHTRPPGHLLLVPEHEAD